MPIDHGELDEAEELLIQRFAQGDCHYTSGSNHSPRRSTITADHYRSIRCQILEPTHDELDPVVMGQVMAGFFSGETSAHSGQERGKTYTMFHHNGTLICKKTFLFLRCMSDKRFKSIKASYLANVVPRVQGNKGKSRKVELSLEEIQDIVLVRHELCWCVQREREGERERATATTKERESKSESKREIKYKDSDVKLLPSSTTKHAIWEFYLQAAATRSVVYPTFTQLWCQLLPNIMVHERSLLGMPPK